MGYYTLANELLSHTCDDINVEKVKISVKKRKFQ